MYRAKAHCIHFDQQNTDVPLLYCVSMMPLQCVGYHISKHMLFFLAWMELKTVLSSQFFLELVQKHAFPLGEGKY